MRVIAGTAGSLPLKCIDGLATRPTTDRIKETLFNMLMPRLSGCRFLDLFAGSGAIGIEALSRGASACVFVESSRKAVACINENLQFTRLAQRAVICATDVCSALGSLEGEKPFDLIFMDPPYHKQLEAQTLTLLSGSSLVDADTLIIVEASLDTDFAYVSSLGFAVTKEKRYKTNKHVFIIKEKS